jgi:hypothetical protein
MPVTIELQCRARIEKVVAYSKGWPGMTTYEMIYDEKGLVKIMRGHITHWKRR